MTSHEWWEPPRFPSDEWYRPEKVWLQSDRIRWRFPGGKREIRPGPSPDLLSEFVALQKGTDAQILAFVRRNGPLGLCAHGLPRWHDRKPRYKGSGILFVGGSCEKVLRGGGELLSWWRLWAGCFAVVLRIAHAIHSNKLGSAEDWQRLVLPTGILERWTGPRDLQQGRGVLEFVLNAWAENVPRWFRVHWGAAPEVRVGGGWLFAVLNKQLVFTACAAKGLAICSACGGPYVPSRRPPHGRRRYCPPCREAGAPLRDAQRVCRQRRQGRTAKRRRKTEKRRVSQV